MIIYFSIFYLCLVPGCILTFWLFSIAGILPPDHDYSVIKNEVAEEQFQILTQKADELSNMLEFPENLTIAELPRIAQDTLELAGELQQQFQEQQELVLSLRNRVEEETAKASEAQRLAKEVQSLTKSQLDAVKLLITEDAKTEANRSFRTGIVVSLPLGIIASVLAKIIYSKLTSQTPQ
ncbi:MAG: hypothetical protein AAGA80_11495 [Cyanobacteria bacterium P01_F01_bin.143]